MRTRNIFRQSECSYPYWLRGRGSRNHKWHIKNKTEFGLFIIKLRNAITNGNRMS